MIRILETVHVVKEKSVVAVAIILGVAIPPIPVAVQKDNVAWVVIVAMVQDFVQTVGMTFAMNIPVVRPVAPCLALVMERRLIKNKTIFFVVRPVERFIGLIVMMEAV